MAVIAAPHQRNRFPLEPANFSIRQDGLQPVSNFDSGAMVLDRVKNQYALIGRLGPNAPFVEEVYCIALDVVAVESINRDQGDLRMSFLIDLRAEVFELRLGLCVQDICEVVNVSGRFELGDGFSGY